MNRFHSQPLRQQGLLALAIWATFASWPYLATAMNQDRLTPDDIAVAEPLQVPLSAAKPPPDQPTTPPASAAELKPQSGWLGLTVDDSLVTGRLVIVEVAEPSPARSVGVRPQDVLLAIDGEPMQTADQLAAVLAAIPPDKQVRALIGRTDGVKEITMKASVRPAATRSPTPVAVTPPAAVEPVTAAPPTASRFSSPAMVAAPEPPTPALPQAAAVTAPTLQPPARGKEPSVAESNGSRFGGLSRQPPATLPTPQAAPLQSVPRGTPSAASTPGGVFQGRTALGVRTVAIDATTQARYRLSEPSGAYVLGVVDSLPASQAGLPPGSVIVAFDNRPIRSPAELNQLVTESQPGRLVALEYVLPGGEARRADIELQALEPALERALIGVPAPDDQRPSAVPQTTQRPLAAAARPVPLRATPRATAEPASDELLQQELSLLREEVLRLRSRLEELERANPARGRSRGDTLR